MSAAKVANGAPGQPGSAGQAQDRGRGSMRRGEGREQWMAATGTQESGKGDEERDLDRGKER